MESDEHLTQFRLPMSHKVMRNPHHDVLMNNHSKYELSMGKISKQGGRSELDGRLVEHVVGVVWGSGSSMGTRGVMMGFRGSSTRNCSTDM